MDADLFGPDRAPLVSLCVEREGWAVMCVDGSYLMDDATWASPADPARDVAVYSCYVRALRRARWVPEAFVVPCR